jgi:hypothetical protein
VWFRTYMQVFYGLFWVVRLNGCVRRGRQPLLRGREWLFAVPVRSGFYAQEGRSILRRFRHPLLLPRIYHAWAGPGSPA